MFSGAVHEKLDISLTSSSVLQYVVYCGVAVITQMHIHAATARP
jgi:hypothetical protein